MSIWNWITDRFRASTNDHNEQTHINPATGLPMVGGIGGIDVGGSTYGFDSQHWQNDMSHHDHMTNFGSSHDSWSRDHWHDWHH